MAKKAGGAGSRTQRGYVAQTKAPKGSYAVPPGSSVGGKGRAKYPIDTLAHAKNALARVSAFGSPQEKKLVKAKVKARFPALAKRSSVIDTGKPRKK